MLLKTFDLKTAFRLTVWLIIFLFFSCQTTVIQFQKGEVDGSAPDFSQQYASMWLGIQEKSKPEKIPCKRIGRREQQVKQAVFRRTPMDALLHFLIGGIYTRRTVEVKCY